MAKAVVSTLTEVPEVLRGEYEVQDDGTFRLKLEGDYPGFAPAAEVEKLREKVNEFRANNIALDKKHKELQASLGRFNGVLDIALTAAHTDPTPDILVIGPVNGLGVGTFTFDEAYAWDRLLTAQESASLLTKFYPFQQG